jgi:membrane protease subunit HflK
MYTQYELNPAITRSRMYYETLSLTLPGVKLYIDLSQGGVQKLLPIESFTGLDEAGLTDPADLQGGSK